MPQVFTEENVKDDNDHREAYHEEGGGDHGDLEGPVAEELGHEKEKYGRENDHQTVDRDEIGTELEELLPDKFQIDVEIPDQKPYQEAEKEAGNE